MIFHHDKYHLDNEGQSFRKNFETHDASLHPEASHLHYAVAYLQLEGKSLHLTSLASLAITVHYRGQLSHRHPWLLYNLHNILIDNRQCVSYLSKGLM